MMICKNCGFEIIDENNKFCPNCGSEIERKQELEKGLIIDNNSKHAEVSAIQSTSSVHKIFIIAGIGILALIIIVNLIVSLTTNSPKKQMERALSTYDSYEVNLLYERANGDSSLTDKYDGAISEFLDEVISDLNSKVYSENDLIENGYTVVSRDLRNDWGSLVYTEDGETIYPSISYYNEDKWDRLYNLINSRYNYCAGVCYLNGYNEPENAIDSLKRVVEEDSYYGSAQEKIAESADMYVQQVLEEVNALVANGDISGAIAKLNSINTYLENNGIATDSVQQKLDETYVAYAKTYYDKAEASFKNKDINAAIGNIEVAIELQPDNGEYKTKYDTYQQYVPFELYLTDNILSYVPGEGGYHFKESIQANDNTSMKNVLYIHSYVAKDFWNSNASDLATTVTYNLGGKYDNVTGQIFLTKDKMNQGFPSYFEAYADGKLIYTSPKMTTGELPKDIKISVTNVQKLELRFYIEISQFNYVSGEFGVSDLAAQKNFPN